jgi:PqqD family protein of HPr-rel-A system
MWRVVPGQLLICREWDGEAVLYNDLSGSTHLLDGAAIEVLQALRAAPAGAAALAQRLAGCYGADELKADELKAELEDMLAELAKLDLVEFSPC